MRRASAGKSWARIAAVTCLVILCALPAHAAMPADELAILRHDVRLREVRMSVAEEAYVIQGALFDSAGVAFAPDAIEGVGRWEAGDKLAPAPLPSPVTWERITSLERRDSGWRRGALIGARVVPVAVYVSVFQDDFEGWAPMFALLSAPLGALGGGIVGALGSVWVPVWRRSPGMEPDSR